MFVSLICLIETFAIGGLFSSVGDQNGEYFAGLKLGFTNISGTTYVAKQLKCLELYSRYQLNPLAYNYIATDEKRPKLSRLFANLCLQHLLIGISGTVSDGA